MGHCNRRPGRRHGRLKAKTQQKQGRLSFPFG
jgi:hypothetical protein